MTMNVEQLREEATAAVEEALAELYADLSPDRAAMEGFARAIAAAAVAAVQHVLDRAETATGGDRIR
jgi:hypothetical protein